MNPTDQSETISSESLQQAMILFMCAFVVACTIYVFGVIDEFSPIVHGVPNNVGGYHILAVMPAEPDLLCSRPNLKIALAEQLPGADFATLTKYGQDNAILFQAGAAGKVSRFQTVWQKRLTQAQQIDCASLVWGSPVTAAPAIRPTLYFVLATPGPHAPTPAP